MKTNFAILAKIVCRESGMITTGRRCACYDKIEWHNITRFMVNRHSNLRANSGWIYMLNARITIDWKSRDRCLWSPPSFEIVSGLRGLCVSIGCQSRKWETLPRGGDAAGSDWLPNAPQLDVIRVVGEPLSHGRGTWKAIGPPASRYWSSPLLLGKPCLVEGIPDY